MFISTTDGNYISLKKILAYVKKNLKSKRKQPRKLVKKQDEVKPLAVLPTAKSSAKQDFNAFIEKAVGLDTNQKQTSDAKTTAPLLNALAVNTIAQPKDTLYTQHAREEELKKEKEDTKAREVKREVASTDMDKYIKLVSLMLTKNLASSTEAQDTSQVNPWKQANEDDASMAQDQLHQAMDAPPEGRAELSLIKSLVGGYAQKLARYRCNHCGFKAKQFYWQCPGCSQWESYAPRRSEELSAMNQV